MTAMLWSMPVAFLAAPTGTERRELTLPWERVAAEGGDPVLACPEPGKIEMFEHLDPDGKMPVDVEVTRARPADFTALVLPGGVAGADQLRANKEAVDLVRGFFDAGKPVAAIGHAPWIIVEAGRVRGRTVTSWPDLRTDVENAGGTWADEDAVTCTRAPNVLVTSRGLADLPEFCEAMLHVFAVLGRR